LIVLRMIRNSKEGSYYYGEAAAGAAAQGN
jgi:hypothetical protein